MQNIKITGVLRDSPADLAGIKEGDFLVSLNNARPLDVFDYRLAAMEETIKITVERNNSHLYFIIEKDEDEDIGLTFESGLMDDVRNCHNNCLFCFVSQNPKGVRPTLMLKDDDYRMSYLMGNYITLTNMDKSDFRRITKLRLLPMNISVHAITPKVRKQLLRNPNSGQLWRTLKFFKHSKVTMNFQIVLCKNLNDGKELTKTIKKLARLMPYAASLSIVPVGLTRYRHGHTPLELFSPEEAGAIVRQV
ncbi:MAG: PDZ domain-containing protein, partial [Defluviitaleaceae bacterium]|nr:PDZ domain-containing protein [Defluviitaleaceae bacterium]